MGGNMKKNVVKINENTIKQIVSESVKKVLKEEEVDEVKDNAEEENPSVMKIVWACEQMSKNKVGALIIIAVLIARAYFMATKK